jgi:alpha-L-fucosidase
VDTPFENHCLQSTIAAAQKLIRALQPDCLVNSRLGLSVEEDPDIDYRTLVTMNLVSTKLDYPWQSPGTVAHSWGFHQSDTEWKSTTTLLKYLISNVSLNGNFMLNIGPKSNGDVPYEISQRMLELGTWLDVNGESVYGAEAFDLPKDQHDWGKSLISQGQMECIDYISIFLTGRTIKKLSRYRYSH